MTGYSKTWVYELVRSYNQEGEAALGDQRRHNKGGSPPILDDTMQAQLFQALEHDPPEGGQWNGRKVADWLSERLGRKIHRQRGWELLKQMEFKRKKPRPEHINAASEEEQREWKKKLHQQIEEIKRDSPDAVIELWAMDEHRLGLQPVLREVWIDPWHGSVIAPVNCRYDWFWLYGFVHPRSGRTYWWLLPKVNIELFNQALADFAEHFGINQQNQVVLVMDQAGWHTSPKVVIPEGVHFAFLPPYSPHMQPAERLWPVFNEALANRIFDSLDDLLERAEQRCLQLLDVPELLSGLTCFHWWRTFDI